MLQWLDQNKEWFFQGIGVTVLVFLFGYLRNPIEGYFYRKFTLNREKEIEEQLHLRLKKMIIERSFIDAEIKIDKEDIEKIEIYCVTFIKNENRKNPFDRIWVKDCEFKIDHNIDGFSLEKEEINLRLKHISFPYKFYMTVPNNSEIKTKYYARLLEAKHIVTGRGKINKDQSKWDIWFLLNNQPVHPDVEIIGSINHTLVNQAIIRNMVYSSKN